MQRPNPYIYFTIQPFLTSEINKIDSSVVGYFFDEVHNYTAHEYSYLFDEYNIFILKYAPIARTCEVFGASEVKQVEQG